MLLFLVGFMGSGKTFIGDYMTGNYGFKCLHMDAEIERREKMKISDIFSTKGEAVFRDLEVALLKEAIEVKKAQLVICGGGLGINEPSQTLMVKKGLKVFLDTPKDECWKRVSTQSVVRPLATCRESFMQLHRSRFTAYIKGAHVIDGSLNEKAIAEKLMVLSRK